MKVKIFGMIISAVFLSGCALASQPPTTNIDESVQKEGIFDRVNSVKNLDLSNQQLKKVPEYVFEKTNIEDLDLSNNQIEGAIQAEIRYMSRLRSLDLSNNLMTGVPAEIGQLENLQVLDLSNNRLTGLPLELGNLKNLKTLNISSNDYSEYDLGLIEKSLPSSVNIIK